MLTLAGVLIYLIALVVFVPVGWLWQQARSYVPLPQEIQVQQVTGHFWEGAAGVDVVGYPVHLSWSLGSPSLLSLSLPVEFSLATSGSRISGNGVVNSSGDGEVSASGVIDVSEFRSLIEQAGGALIDGSVRIDRLNLAWQEQRLTKADGLGTWDGGLVSWPMGNTRGRADFPPMRATLDSTSNGVSLEVAAQQGDGPAADAEIRWTGMMDLRVYKRMVDLAGQPWSESASPGDVVFRVRQPLIPGSALR